MIFFSSIYLCKKTDQFTAKINQLLKESGAPRYNTELGLELHRSTFRGPVIRTTEQLKSNITLYI